LKIAPLETLIDLPRGRLAPLPQQLATLYGNLRLPNRKNSFVFSNFVTTLDGVVSLQKKGHAAGSDISGFSAQDRMVMGLLRAVADAVIVGSGTLDADRRHVWTAADICPELAGAYQLLRTALRDPPSALNVIVSARGSIDLRDPVFTSGRVTALIITTPKGAKALLKRKIPSSVLVRTTRRDTREIHAAAILDEVSRVNAASRILVEGGPRLLGTFYKERCLDEQFLSLAPQISGRDTGDARLSLVMGKSFAPADPLWGSLIDARRGSRLLFLRYRFRSGQMNDPQD
jgi:riboflavin biosynthesis pyrimidine reductase